MDPDSRPQSRRRPLHLLTLASAVIAVGSWAGVDGHEPASADSNRPRGGPLAEGRCASPGSRLVVRSSRIVVYEIRRDGRVPGAGTGRLAACVISTGRRRILAIADATGYWFGPPADAVAVHGTLVAFPVITVGDGASPEVGLTMSLTDFRRPQRERTLAFEEGKVGSIVVTSSGRIAWIECALTYSGGDEITANPRPECVGPGKTTMTIRTGVPKTGIPGREATVIATGRDIDPLSLRLSGTQITWREAGSLRRADLP